MKGGIAWYTLPIGAKEVSRLFSHLGGDNITLLNPATKRATFLSEEPGKEGIQLVVEPDDLAEKLAALDEPLSFQLWLDDESSDVVTRYRRLNDWVVQEFEFRGLTHEQAEPVIGAVSRCAGADWIAPSP